MPLDSIVMPYKDNCKVEGEVITKIKIARLYFAHRQKQSAIAKSISCHKNTVNTVIRLCKDHATEESLHLLRGTEKIHTNDLLLFDFLKHGSRAPRSHSRSLTGDDEQFIVDKHEDLHYGVKRMFRHLKRQGYDMNTYTIGKIKGVYNRNKLLAKKVRTVNGERRNLYNYSSIGAFEELQYDTKHIADEHALPKDIYDLFKKNNELPNYQWTIVDAKTKTRFLAWSYELSSFFGFMFLILVTMWLRAHMIRERINCQIDGGSEFCSASKRKLKEWNKKLFVFNVLCKDTGGSKWKQNLVERTHRIDDEEFYCPRGTFMKTKKDFFREASFWNPYYNDRPSEGIGLEGISPREKCEKVGLTNAKSICSFPAVILEDLFPYFQTFLFDFQKSQNVLTYYQILRCIINSWYNLYREKESRAPPLQYIKICP